MNIYMIISLLIMGLYSGCSNDKTGTQAPVPREKSEVEILREKTRDNPRDAAAWFHLADLYERADMFREEVDALKKVVAIKPEHGYASLKLGNAYNRLGLYREAVGSFSNAGKYLPKDPVLYNNAAFAYGKLGEIDNQIASLKNAVSLRPRYATARFNLGVSFLKKGLKGDALKQYQELKKFDEGVAESLKKEIDAKRK